MPTHRHRAAYVTEARVTSEVDARDAGLGQAAQPERVVMLAYAGDHRVPAGRTVNGAQHGALTVDKRDETVPSGSGLDLVRKERDDPTHAGVRQQLLRRRQPRAW